MLLPCFRTDWPAAARRELAFIHKQLLQAHPAALLADAHFAQQLHAGYHAALAQSSSIDSRRHLLALLRRYLTAFHDIHLGIDDPRPRRAACWTPGWHLRWQHGRCLVDHIEPGREANAPPPGAELLGCDGRPLADFIAAQIAPWVDSRLQLQAAWYRCAWQLSRDHDAAPCGDGHRFSHCELRLPDGTRRRYAPRWQPAVAGPQRATLPAFSLQQIDTVYWLRAGSFAPDSAGRQQLHAVAAQLAALPEDACVVLDIRGNGGGDSRIGDTLLRQLLGSAFPNDSYRGRCHKRLSPQLLTKWRTHLAEHTGSLDGEQMAHAQHQLAAMERQLATGTPWLIPEHTSGSDAIAGTRHFRGRLLLLTSHNASAALDFADTALHYPGTLHLGWETDADSRYMDIATVSSPVGFALSLPVQVWHGRWRGHNQPLRPTLRFDGDIHDDAAVQAWVGQQLARNGHHAT